MVEFIRYVRFTIFATELQVVWFEVSLSIRLDWRHIILPRHSTLISTCGVSNQWLRFAFVDGASADPSALLSHFKRGSLAMARKMSKVVNLLGDFS